METRTFYIIVVLFWAAMAALAFLGLMQLMDTFVVAQ